MTTNDSRTTDESRPSDDPRASDDARPSDDSRPSDDARPSDDSRPSDESRPSVGHVHLRVRELEPAIEFYRDVLGLEPAERHGRYAFLTFGEHHHDVALQAVGPDAPGPSRGVGLYHVAFEVDSPGELRAVTERLDERGVRYSPVDHGISRALYFDDPSGNGIEVYHDDRDERDQWAWDGLNRPFDPTAL